MTSRAGELAQLVRERGLTACITFGYEIAAELERLARLDEQTAKVVIPEQPASRCIHTSLDDFQGCDHGQRDFIPVKQIPSELILMKGFWESADGEIVQALDLCEDCHAARRFRPLDEPWMVVLHRAMVDRYRRRRAETGEGVLELRAFARFVEGGAPGESVVPTVIARSLIVNGPVTGWKAVIDGPDIKMRHPPYPIHMWHRSIVLKTINLLLKVQPPCSHPSPTS